MSHALKKLVQEYGWIHLGIGLAGNALFVIGSVLFLPDMGSVTLPWQQEAIEVQTIGVWLFIAGAALMFIGSLGSLMVGIYNDLHRPK